jgi:dsDNA-specific endonuclease/ATPase MutS2
MDTKLTLSLDKDIIEQAKKYAKKQNISLSKLIESYLNKVSMEDRETPEISPLVKSLSGVLPLPKGLDPKKSYGNFLAAKYKVK